MTFRTMGLSASQVFTFCQISAVLSGLVISLTVVAIQEGELSDTVKPASKGNIKFSLDLYKELAKENGNFLTSPVSLEIILALTYLGAKGNTARQIAKFINRNDDTKTVTSDIFSLLKVLKSGNNVTLESANGMFIHNKIKLKDEFKVASELLSSTVQNTDFNDTHSATLAINSWVERITNGKIKNIVSEDSITPLTKLMLVNAIYFKAPWKIPFNKKQTSIEPFYVNQTLKKDVPMMYMKKRLGYSQIDELECDVLELQYEGQNLSMIILLPHQINGLRALENQIHEVDVIESLRTMYPVEVEVALPRFMLETEINLNPILVKMGLTDMFDENLADFSGISDTNLVVSHVKQKSFVEVNEKGTEAAASTRVSLEPRFLSMPEIFKADHPFMFIIVNKLIPTILFMGHIIMP